MPIVTENQLARINSMVRGVQNKAVAANARLDTKMGQLKDGLEIVGAASVMGIVRGYLERQGTPFVIPGTPVDIELVTGAALAGAGIAGLFGQYDDDVIMAGYGCLAHYFGQTARNSAKAGTPTLVAGYDIVGEGPPAAALGDTSALDNILSGTL